MTDPIVRHEAQRLATEAVRALIDAMYEQDPLTRHWHARYTIISDEVVARVVGDAVGHREPLTVEIMERAVRDALGRPHRDERVRWQP